MVPSIGRAQKAPIGRGSHVIALSSIFDARSDARRLPTVAGESLQTVVIQSQPVSARSAKVTAG